MKYLVERPLHKREGVVRKRPIVIVCGNTDIVSPQELFIRAVQEILEEIRSIGGMVTTTDQLGVDGIVRETCEDMGIPIIVRKCSLLMLTDYSSIDQRVSQLYSMHSDISSDVVFPITIIDQYRNQSNFYGEHIRVVVKKKSFSVIDVIRTGRTSEFHKRENLDQPTMAYVTSNSSQVINWVNSEPVNDVDIPNKHYAQWIDSAEPALLITNPTLIPPGDGIISAMSNDTKNSYIYNQSMYAEKMQEAIKDIYKTHYT